MFHVKQGDVLRVLETSILAFRNLKRINASFKGRNIIIGDNAQGKTSLLEAIYILCMSKSFKAITEDNLIAFGSNEYTVNGIVNNSIYTKKMRVTFDRSGSKHLLVNEKKIKSIEYIGIINVTIMIPEDIAIISGDSSERRRYLDISISQTDRQYLKVLSEYHRVLKHRNALLKAIKDNRQRVTEISYWNTKMCEVSKEIVNKRQDFLSEISNSVVKLYNHMNNSGEKVEIEYKNSTVSGLEASHENYEKAFDNSLKRVLNEEIGRGHSIIGAHRDDLIIRINGQDARRYASLGQQRSGVISLRLAAHNYMRDHKGASPILLVDDILSELDEKRKNKFLELLNNDSQLFITGTNIKHFGEYFSDGNHIAIKNGEISNAL